MYAIRGLARGKRIIGGMDGKYRFAAPWEKSDHGVYMGIDEELRVRLIAEAHAKREEVEEEDRKMRQIVIETKWEKQKEWLENRPKQLAQKPSVVIA